MNRSQKYLPKEIRVPILLRYIIDGETWLYNFGRIDVYYLSDIQFERLAAGETTECRLGMIFCT